MLSKKITSRYAKALFTTAGEMKLLDRANHDMQLVYDVCKSSVEFMRLIVNPVIREDKKKSIIDKIFGDHLHRISILFIHILLRQGRGDHIMEVASAYTAMYKEHEGIKTVQLQSAVELDTKTRDMLKDTIKKQINYDIELVETVNKDLIGGFVLKMDHKQYDASIANKLKTLEKQLSINI
ncbi:MAG: ATP synthase F1 subunit delta [Bacteroidales bacterium]|nr:ATP synthase F1 subunit delta [Bacteroidales bacterium]